MMKSDQNWVSPLLPHLFPTCEILIPSGETPPSPPHPTPKGVVGGVGWWWDCGVREWGGEEVGKQRTHNNG
jgi:hypothetical protein